MAVSADDLLQDIPCGFGPDERFGIHIVMGDVTINSLSKEPLVNNLHFLCGRHSLAAWKQTH